MDEPLRILFIEDSAPDAELEERELRSAGLSFVSKRVDTPEGLLRALAEFEPQLIISDYSLPTLDGMTALRMVREVLPEVPFIFVSGTIGEERAIESLKNGATDYVVKDRLEGLSVKVQRALGEADARARHRLLEEQFRQSQKMEAMGRLAGGIAHDFNNLLTVIGGYTQLMLLRLPEGDILASHTQEVVKASERAASLTGQLLAFSRKQVVDPRVFNLNRVVSEMEKLLVRLIGEDVQLVTLLDPELGNVKADPGQIEQVLMNLAVNARDAMPNGGELRLETGNVVFDEDFARYHPGVQPGPQVYLAVSDTGIGMDEETRSHLFEPFFTTKERGKGTGLGLSTVYGIVKQSEGSIWVDSEPGRGATFRVYLPRVDEPVKPVKERVGRSTLPRGTETVLVVEDEEAVRHFMSEVLIRHGYSVLAAADGEEALRAIDRHQGPIQLLITDLVLPSMGGSEIALRVAQLRPGIKVVFTSGYTDREVTGPDPLGSGTAFLPKPFTPDELLGKAREALEGGS